MPFWFSFCFLPLEFCPVSHTIARQLGNVLAEDIPSDATRDHWFCVAMDITKGWVASIGRHAIWH